MGSEYPFGPPDRANRCHLRWWGNEDTGSSTRSDDRFVKLGTATAEAPLPHIGAWPGHIQVAILTGDPSWHFPRLPPLNHAYKTSQAARSSGSPRQRTYIPCILRTKYENWSRETYVLLLLPDAVSNLRDNQCIDHIGDDWWLQTTPEMW